jgi:UDP-N-acetylmuramate dehydrogenase
MFTIVENVSLLPYNTFGIDVNAKYFAIIRSLEEAEALFASRQFKENKHLILGGGSNLLFTTDFDGLVVKNELKGITTVGENEESIVLRAGSGENWHELVLYCVDRNYGGIENLSLIPGTVGAAPMQNIGAYGVEIKEVIHNVETIELSTGRREIFSNEQCKFGYRESVFKQELKDKYFISSITLSLTKANHRFSINYGAIREVLKQNGEKRLSVKNISDAVIAIRKSKLPDPNVIGNAGSFFKNPTVNTSTFEALQKNFYDLPSFPAENGLTKIPAAWLIEKSGWKGKTLDNIGVHKHQALVIVNYGGGDGKKIWELAMNIQSSVKEKFNITLQPEVNVI